jgi:cell division protein FtsN
VPTKPEETTEVVKPPVKPEKAEKTDGKPRVTPNGPRPRRPCSTSRRPREVLPSGRAFEDPSEADNLKARLALMGVEASVQKVELPEKGTVHRVRMGPTWARRR